MLDHNSMQKNEKYDIWHQHEGHALTCEAAHDLDGIPEMHIICKTCDSMVFAVPQKVWGNVPPGIRKPLADAWLNKDNYSQGTW